MYIGDKFNNYIMRWNMSGLAEKVNDRLLFALLASISNTRLKNDLIFLFLIK